jgi:hypothetical protein
MMSAHKILTTGSLIGSRWKSAKSHSGRREQITAVSNQSSTLRRTAQWQIYHISFSNEYRSIA